MERIPITAKHGHSYAYDIRDFESGQVYYALADKARGGRCFMRGMFIAAWERKEDAKYFAEHLANAADLTVVRCLKP